MAKKAVETKLDYSFFGELFYFYQRNRKQIKTFYRDLTKKFLDYNDPENANSFLRKPQFEALEIYVFLKEFGNNRAVHDLFHDWYYKNENFSKIRSEESFHEGKNTLFKMLPEDKYFEIFKIIERNAESYSNYIFALTMGTGKTLLMATCIFYEFLLANKFPKDPKYCHNALIFAPDKTVLQSLKEIVTFDKSKVVPSQYVDFLNSNVKIHFMEDTGTLNTIDKSKYNIIISNTQKIILKRKNKDLNSVDKLYKKLHIDTGSKIDELTKDIWNFDNISFGDSDVQVNQRFQKLLRLEQLGIYVDEAHHLFGQSLEADMVKSTKTSLRMTIDELADNLKKAGTRVVACYNYTGTPYIKNRILPEVVYAYGLRDAIQQKYLKQLKIKGYKNIKEKDYLREIVKEFWDSYSGKTYEGLKPKLAIFAAQVKDITEELRPMLEEVLVELGISTDKILVNVGDTKETTSDDVKNFNNLDIPGSIGNDKQFILLVNKGREGWNCKSLFGVGLFREPKSKIFVLQATMRCLRQIGDYQETGRVFLSENNYDILQSELKDNFKLSISDINQSDSHKEKPEQKVKIVEPVKKLILKRVKHKYELEKIEDEEPIHFRLKELDLEKYKTKVMEMNITAMAVRGTGGKDQEEEISQEKEKIKFSLISLVGEISRYLNYSCLKIEDILNKSVEGVENILEFVNQYNDILYDEIIPKIFRSLYDIKENIETTEETIELIKNPKGKEYFEFRAEEDMVVHSKDVSSEYQKKSFHVDTYCFDSKPEREFFWSLLKEKKIKEVYFTGMFVQGQSDFYIQYIDPESMTVRNYYPDFLVQKEDGVWEILEVKGDNKLDDAVVMAKKKFAEEMALENKMEYKVIPSSEIMNGKYVIS